MNSISSKTPLEEESPIVSTPSQMSKVNTNYLDRFLRASSIAPDLICMHVFPNVKELTESMAVYYHTHNYILSKQEIKESYGVVKDAILCIGDGSTPRSASIFALSYPEWQCYSIDPQLQEGYIRTGEKEKDKLKHDMSKLRQERRSLWESIPNLHIVGECIEKVRIHCRRAVIVMVHCHLSFQQIMSSIECEEIAGVISLPCCNFFQIQEKFMGQLPSYEFHDDGIWSDKNTVRIWEHPSIQWVEDYHSYLDDSCILPYQLDTSAILSSSDLQRIPLNTHTTVVGEITAIRKFGKKLTFVFINTSNIYYCSNSNQYWYYENHAYDVHNTCLNAAPILLKCDANSLPADQYQQLYSCILTLKNHCLIQGEGNVILSKQGKKIVDLLDLKLLNSNKQLANAQRMICGVDFDFLDLPCVNERNINYCNKDLGMLIVC